MQEDYLHYLWEFQKWKDPELTTVEGLPLRVLSPGVHNFLSGPDFFNSRIVVGDQQWAGNVEVHINSSDWYLHGHEQDEAYDNVVLHVVWNHDLEIFRRDNSTIPVLELRNRISVNAINQYEHLMEGALGKWINCEKDFSFFDDFSLNHWLERLYFERLEKKAASVFALLEKCAGDWEEVLFRMLARNFGLNVNGDAFFSVATSIPFKVIRKCRKDQQKLEALFLGQAGLLSKDCQENYFQDLKQEYLFLRKKFSLSTDGIIPVKYFRLRPDNFPEIRLVQLAGVFSGDTSVFALLQKISEIEDFHSLLSAEIPRFWKTHYTFQKSHSHREKRLTQSFRELVIINTLVPVKFCFQQKQGTGNDDLLVDLMSLLPREENQIVNRYNKLRPGTAENALQSQAVLQLKKEYCDKKGCVRCALGLKLLQKEEEIS